MRTFRRFSAVVLAACTLTMVGVAAPSGAAQPDPAGGPAGGAPGSSTRIIGGFPAGPGAWPSQVGLLNSGVSNNFQAQFCGGTVINPSWILTAAHCLEDFTAHDIDVLIGTQSLASGGVRHWVAETRMFPSYVSSTYNYDFGLIRIADPTSAPLQPIVGQGASIGAGTPAIATGWGNQDADGNSFPTELYQVGIPVISNATCANAGYGSAITSQMLCAGASPYLDKDTCQGDSGGPLMIAQGGKWVQAGITSWGDGCAEGLPGVYSRIAAQSNWIKAQIRFGPHSNASEFVWSTWWDLYGTEPSNTSLFLGVAAQNSTSPATWLAQQIQGKTYQARMGGVTRLYRAFFLRDPDISGMDFWWNKMNNGWSLWNVAEYFSQSPEFNSRYGSLNNGQYVDLVYQNVLGRAPDAGGRTYWVNQLASGAKNRGQVMVGFSESPEYSGANKARTDVLITYFGLVGRLPGASDLAYWVTQPNSSLVSALFGSLEYHSRF